jgi:F0F1-type ATP synthase assembly protein I
MSAGPSSNGPNNGPSLPLGLMLIGSEMVSFTIFGLMLDYFLHTMPGFTIGLTLMGLAAAFLHMKQMAKRLAEKKPKEPADGG